MIDIYPLVDLSTSTYMGAVLMWYWLAVCASFFLGFLPLLLLISITLDFFTGILKRASRYG